MSSVRLPEVESNRKFLNCQPKSSCRCRLREVVVCEGFLYKALTENIFRDLGRWSPTKGSTVHTCRFLCDGFESIACSLRPCVTGVTSPHLVKSVKQRQDPCSGPPTN